MKSFKLTLAGLFGAAVALSAAAGNPASKNVIDAAYRPLPSDWWNLVKTEPEMWNSSFVRDEAKWPHTQISLAADRAFREQVMRPMTDERGGARHRLVGVLAPDAVQDEVRGACEALQARNARGGQSRGEEEMI